MGNADAGVARVAEKPQERKATGKASLGIALQIADRPAKLVYLILLLLHASSFQHLD